MTARVAALFVDPRGPYFGRADVDPWDESRDAREYRGGLPVVAHPPCQLWVNLAGVNFVRYGGPHNRPGNDRGCFMRALESVRKCGGVLEHPAGSFAWSTFALRKPQGIGWEAAGSRASVCEVWQSAYGHPARKRTWLYYVGDQAPFDLRWEREPGTHQVGWFDRKKPALGKRTASETPPAFAEELIRLALHSRAQKEVA